MHLPMLTHLSAGRSTPIDDTDWRTLVRRRLTRREYRPSPEVVAAPETFEQRLPGSGFETGVVDRLAARAELVALGPLPRGVQPYAAAVLTDDVPSPAAAHCARQWRYLQRRGVA